MYYYNGIGRRLLVDEPSLEPPENRPRSKYETDYYCEEEEHDNEADARD